MLNEILKSIFSEMDGMSEESIKDMLSNVNIKVVRNGEPIVNIENGVDLLHKEEEPIADAPQAESNEDANVDASDVDVDENDDEDCYGPGESFTEVTPYIYKDDFDETYFITESVKNNRITGETSLTFNHTGEDGITTPGITDADLVWVLLYRNRDNEVLREKLVDLLKTL